MVQDAVYQEDIDTQTCNDWLNDRAGQGQGPRQEQEDLGMLERRYYIDDQSNLSMDEFGELFTDDEFPSTDHLRRISSKASSHGFISSIRLVQSVGHLSIYERRQSLPSCTQRCSRRRGLHETQNQAAPYRNRFG